MQFRRIDLVNRNPQSNMTKSHFCPISLFQNLFLYLSLSVFFINLWFITFHFWYLPPQHKTRFLSLRKSNCNWGSKNNFIFWWQTLGKLSEKHFLSVFKCSQFGYFNLIIAILLSKLSGWINKITVRMLSSPSGLRQNCFISRIVMIILAVFGQSQGIIHDDNSRLYLFLSERCSP